MDRHKLFIEKVMDKKEILYRPPRSRKEIPDAELFAAERFLFNSEDTKALWTLDRETKMISLLNPPYPAVWIESVFEKSRYAVYAYYRHSAMPYPNPKYKTALLLFSSVGGKVMEVGYLGDSKVELHEELKTITKVTHEQWDHMLKGIFGEITAALGLFHVQGDIIKQRIDAPEKVNARRTKKGKNVIPHYTHIYLDRSIKEATNSSPDKDEIFGVARHLVRGHFKRRETGTFWWRPHFAGTLPETPRAGYIVKGASDAIQKPSPTSILLQEPPTSGNGVGEGNPGR